MEPWPAAGTDGRSRSARASGQRRALGALFALLAVGFAGIAYAALTSDAGAGRRIVVAVAAGALAVWLLSLAARTLR